METGITKIYDRVYDNPYNVDGSMKPNKLLGEFKIVQVLENDLYHSVSVGIRIPDNKVCVIIEREIPGYNGGSYFNVYELDGMKFENEKELT
jgi:hypothetical protein